MKAGTTIQQKIMRIVLITSGIVVFLTCAAFIAYQFISFKISERRQLQTLGEVIAANSTAALAFGDTSDASEMLRALNAQEHVVAACIYDSVGKVFARYPDTIENYNLPFLPGKEGYRYVGTFLEGFQAVTQGNVRVGTLYLKSDLKAIYQTTTRYVIIGAIFFAAAFVVAYLLSKRLQKKVLQPIMSLSKTAGIISQEKNYSVRAERFDNDEFGLLTDAFNKMLQQIERQNREIKTLNADLEEKVRTRTAELEKTNKELTWQTALAEAIIDSSVDVIAVFDTDLRYVVLNKYGRDVYHVSSDQVIGKQITEIFPGAETSSMYQDLKAALNGTLIHSPYHKSPMSGIILENFFIPLRDSDNRVYSVLMIGHDVTAIVAGNEKLKKLNVTLEHSNRDLEQFAYIASHDLQEPLRKIQIFSSQLERTLDNRALVEKTISKITSSASRMSDLINGVLNYSRLGSAGIHYTQVSLQSVVYKIMSDFELLIEERGAVVQVHPLPSIEGIELQINQLFSNLFSNALKFSSGKPHIQISAEIKEGTMLEPFDNLNPETPYAVICFKDDGIGFSQEYAHNIFSVFQRLHSKDEYPGTGIGLALCKKVVDNHNGHISVRSEIGKGTAFTIYLPLRQEPVSL